ncbi:helix-turn-helix domain-containing protein [Fibrella sp. HMF5335]|uniref:Helix-turn-helix domain-containing protein n=1 Tax=Fibrella rubiginis TaxID=2817060 RepID=A0A939K6F1_9BACT|nr:helix-turn-helix domain-containing protein [Fibrella rubiginis]MBO0938768.1 helix-turn-helix domain-containing protein [Fibrella rubiginis]
MIKTLRPAELNEHHFRSSGWQVERTAVHDLFHINRIEAIREKLEFPILPHRKTLFDFLLLTQGQSRRSKGLNDYQFEANTLFFLPAYQISTHEWMSEDARGFFCHFDWGLIEQVFPHSRLFDECLFLQPEGNPLVSIEAASVPSLIYLLERLEQEYARPSGADLSVIAVYLTAFFAELKQMKQASVAVARNAAYRIMQAYKNALSQHIYKRQHITDYAELLSVTPDHLNKCVRTTTGKSAQDLLMEMLLLEAKVLLSQTQLSIGDIAYKLTEKTPSDFSRFFKAKTGLTPKQYKQLTAAR